MEELLISATRYSVLFIDAMALIVIVIGSVQVAIAGIGALLTSRGGRDGREVWLRYGRWLVAGLTFQLAADIIETSIAPDWQDIGKLAAIAAIRTFLNFFLERDLAEMREREVVPEAAVSRPDPKAGREM